MTDNKHWRIGLMTDLLTGHVRVPEHFGVRRHDAALGSYEHLRHLCAKVCAMFAPQLAT